MARNGRMSVRGSADFLSVAEYDSFLAWTLSLAIFAVGVVLMKLLF